MNVTEVLDEISKLAREERVQVAERLSELNDAEGRLQTDDEKRRALHRQLLAEGVIKNIPTRYSQPPTAPPPRDFRPVPIEGKPLSETIIEERR